MGGTRIQIAYIDRIYRGEQLTEQKTVPFSPEADYSQRTKIEMPPGVIVNGADKKNEPDVREFFIGGDKLQEIYEPPDEKKIGKKRLLDTQFYSGIEDHGEEYSISRNSRAISV